MGIEVKGIAAMTVSSSLLELPVVAADGSAGICIEPASTEFDGTAGSGSFSWEYFSGGDDAAIRDTVLNRMLASHSLVSTGC